MILQNPEHMEAHAVTQYLQQVVYSMKIKQAQATTWATIDPDGGLRLMVRMVPTDPGRKERININLRLEIRYEDDDAGESWKNG